MSYSLPEYLQDTEVVALRDADGSETIVDEETFHRTADELSKKLAIRSTREELARKNIIKTSDNVAPQIIQNKLALDKEKMANALNRRLSHRPSVSDLKMRNILKDEEQEKENVASFETRKSALKGVLKKRPEKSELEEQNIIKAGDNIDPSLAAKQIALKQNQLKNTLDAKLRDRPAEDELKARKIIGFQPVVEVFNTFKKAEYNRKPDDNATFRKLTPQMKVQIREELNNFKRNEMDVAEDSAHNTCFH